jgi:hypothetical protein
LKFILNIRNNLTIEEKSNVLLDAYLVQYRLVEFYLHHDGLMMLVFVLYLVIVDRSAIEPENV